MTEDDICGCETATGEPCQNPATDGDSCWLAEHGGDSDPSGRPSKLEEYEDDILEAARQGLTYEGIARVAGVGVSTLHEWRDEYPQFSESLERARSVAERELIEGVDPEFVLERSYGYTKSQEVEHTGDGLSIASRFVVDEEEEDDE